MAERKRAYFVKYPRRLAELKVLHLISDEKPYEVIKTVFLGATDFKNFSEDLLADRVFLDGFSESRWNETVYRCVWVRRRNGKDGILVVPTADGHVKYAAFQAADAPNETV